MSDSSALQPDLRTALRGRGYSFHDLLAEKDLYDKDTPGSGDSVEAVNEEAGGAGLAGREGLPTGKPQKGSKSKSGGEFDLPRCRICEDPRAAGAAWCKKHKRAAECIKKDALKKTAVGDYRDPGSAANYFKVFGEDRRGPPNLTLAARVLNDFCNAHPEKRSAAQTQKRGSVDLGRYVTTHGQQQARGDYTDAPLWDRELFINQLHNLRGWNLDYADKQFTMLLTAPGSEVDNGGPNGACRVRVPAVLLSRSKWSAAASSKPTTMSQ